MIKLHKPKICIKTGSIIEKATVKLNLHRSYNPDELERLGTQLLSMAHKAKELNRKVSK
jgi:hypothetical protein